MGKESEKINMGDLVNLLHSTVFSLEKALQEKMGKEHIVITSHSAKYIHSIEKKKSSNFFSGKNLDDAIRKFEDYASNSEFFDLFSIKKIDSERYQVDIEGCGLAKSGVHDILNPERDVCPMSLVAASILKYVDPDRDVIAEPTRFNDSGSSTDIHFIKIT